MGRNKLFEVIEGQNLLQRAVNHLSEVSQQIIVVSTERRSLPSFTSPTEIQIVTDIYANKSVLGGLYTGLKHSGSCHSLVIACDMPFLSIPLLRYLISLAPGFDVVVPRLGGLLEPLHAVYSKNCLSPIEEALRQGELKVTAFFPGVKMRYVDGAEMEQFDPQHLSFFNINSEADLKKARALVQPPHEGKTGSPSPPN